MTLKSREHQKGIMSSIDKLRSFLLGLGTLVEIPIEIDGHALKNKLNEQSRNWTSSEPDGIYRSRATIALVSRTGEEFEPEAIASLSKYNAAHKTNYVEEDFKTPTPFFKNTPELWEPLKLLSEHFVRTRIVALGEGGYFPPHRDGYLPQDRYVRLLSIIGSDATADSVVFILDGQIRNLKQGQLYYFDSRLKHSCFSFQPNVYLLIASMEVNAISVGTVLSYFSRGNG